MSKRCRVLLLWVMALVLPLQGMAAAAMVVCASASMQQHGLVAHQGLLDRAAQAVPVQLHAADVAHAAHAGATAHQHHADPASNWASPAADDSPAANPPGPHSGHGTLKCCSVVGALGMLQAPPSLALAPARFAAPVPPAGRPDLGVVPAGIDRPPRASRA